MDPVRFIMFFVWFLYSFLFFSFLLLLFFFFRSSASSQFPPTFPPSLFSISLLLFFFFFFFRLLLSSFFYKYKKTKKSFLRHVCWNFVKSLVNHSSESVTSSSSFNTEIRPKRKQNHLKQRMLRVSSRKFVSHHHHQPSAALSLCAVACSVPFHTPGGNKSSSLCANHQLKMISSSLLLPRDFTQQRFVATTTTSSSSSSSTITNKEQQQQKSPLHQKLDSLINKGRITVFLTGTPMQPRCGFTVRMVEMLEQLPIKYEYVDIMQDEEVCEGLKEYSNWPTYPQLYIDGELVGGWDVTRQMVIDGTLIQHLHEKGLLLDE